MIKKPAILILVKRSSYDQYLLKDITKKGKGYSHLSNQEIKRYKRTHDQHYETLAYVERILKDKPCTFKRVYRGQKCNYEAFDLIITVGGDGTFLEASHHLKHQKILGVNSDPNWSVGRFCSATVKTAEAMIDRYLSEKNQILPLSRFALHLSYNKKPIIVLNDILLCHQNPAAMSRYIIATRSIREEQRSSGVWVSTPAGSSGAIHSAGAEIIPLSHDVHQYRPRELYQGAIKRNYQLKGGLIERGQKLSITSLMKEGCVYVDGSHVMYPLTLGDRITVTHTPHPLNMILS